MKAQPTDPKDRAAILTETRNLKMSRSAHAYVRGNTVKFYEWLQGLKSGSLPDGPPVWICGDCHVGNLGPLSNSAGQIEIQIRDLDQTMVGNPAHDLIRLGLSLASAARGSDLPGVTTARMLEQMVEGYEAAFEPDFNVETDAKPPKSINRLTKESAAAFWGTLARERRHKPDNSSRQKVLADFENGKAGNRTSFCRRRHAPTRNDHALARR
jgi:uncharacterized protein (DUF2252 family)